MKTLTANSETLCRITQPLRGFELARWCVSNGLLDQARKELREALRRESDSTVAKNMLQRINDQLLTTKDVPAVAQRNGQFSFLGDAKPGIAAGNFGRLAA